MRRREDRVRIYSRRGADFTDRFPRVVDAVRRLKVRSVVLDGEGADGVAICSVSERYQHVLQHWRGGVDTMPLMSHGGRTPSGDADIFEAALRAFTKAFMKVACDRAAGCLGENLEHKRAGAERWK